MSRISRRDFLVGATAAAGTVALGRRLSHGAEAKQRITSGTDVVALGRSGLKTSVLGIGTGTHGGREQRDIGQDNFTKLVHHAYERGVRYIDTADMYMTHMFVRFAIKSLPREKLFIQTKTRAKHPEVAKADIERFRREMNCGYIDSLLMHCMTKKGWCEEMRPIMDVLSEAKEKGRVKAVGISCHGMDPLVDSVDCDWIDTQLVRINPNGVMMDGPPEEVSALIKRMHDKGRGVLGMKIFGEGQMPTPEGRSQFPIPKKHHQPITREERLRSLKYVLGLGTVDAFTIGFSTPEQIDETLEDIETALS